MNDCKALSECEACHAVVCAKDGRGGLMIDGRSLVVCRAVSQDAVQQIASQNKTEMTNSRNLHLVRESCMFYCVLSAL